MKKLFIPAICILISFSFSGKSLKPTSPAPVCGPTITIDNSSSYTVTKVDVKHIYTGVTTSYVSPSFPFTHSGSGGNFRITYFFSPGATGCIWYSAWDDCQAVPFYGATAAYVDIFAGCGSMYALRIIEDPEFHCE